MSCAPLSKAKAVSNRCQIIHQSVCEHNLSHQTIGQGPILTVELVISFAACFAFYLSTLGSSGNISLAPSIRMLIEESAEVLQRIGSDPPHRNGVSALYGRHLHEIVRASQRNNGASTLLQPRSSYQLPQNTHMQAPMQTYQNPPDMQMTELMQFSAMSDDQINEAINNAGDELQTYPNFQMDDKTGLDWLDWFNMDVNLNMPQ